MDEDYKKNKLWLSKQPEEFLSKPTEVFIFSNHPAYVTGGGQRYTQLAKGFCALGKKVHYLYCQSFEDILLDENNSLGYLHQAIYTIGIDEAFANVTKDTLCIFEMPHQDFIPWLMEAKKRKLKTVYEQIDNWDTSLGKTFYNKENFQIYLDNCEHLVVTSKNLSELLIPYTKKAISYIPNAVDDNVFAPNRIYEKPSDMVTGSKTVLYFGALARDWIDWELITQTADLCKDCSFIMIGDNSSDLLDDIASSHPNIHFIGAKQQRDLPAYLAYSDCAIIPFKVDDTGKYVSPIKIFEYLSMRVHVLTTPMPDIAGYPNTFISGSAKEWANDILTFVKPIETSAINEINTRLDSFIDSNNWIARCKTLLDL